MHDRYKPNRRDFIIGAGSILVSASLPANSEGGEAKKYGSLLEITPKHSEGIYKMLARFGLNNPMAYGLFQDLNSDDLGPQEIIYTKNIYHLPIIQATVSQSLAETLHGSHVPYIYIDKIHKYNLEHNGTYESQDANKIKKGQIIYIPAWGTGFYNESQENSNAQTHAPNIKNVPPNKPRQEIIRNEDKGASGLPYTALKKALGKEGHESLLEKYCFVIDPGHGGNDPGALRTIKDGAGEKVTVYEAPLVYDVSMRLLREIIKKGGLAYLTHYSEEFGIQEIKNPTKYRNQKYNFDGLGRTQISQKEGRNEGGSLTTRRKISERIVHNKTFSKGRKVIFVSIHADSLESHKRLPITLYVDRKRSNNHASHNKNLKIATDLSKYLGQRGGRKSHVVSKGLGVLRGNPAYFELLIELGNLNNASDAWLMRDPKNRERMARSITRAFVKVQP